MGVKMKNADTKIVIVVIGVLVLYLANLFLLKDFCLKKVWQSRWNRLIMKI